MNIGITTQPCSSRCKRRSDVRRAYRASLEFSKALERLFAPPDYGSDIR
jgi:hypothetical protein